MRFRHIIEQVSYRPWFITPEGYRSLKSVVESRLAGSVRADDGEPDDMLTQFVNPRMPMQIDANGVAMIHVCGVLGKGLSPIEKSCGNTDYCDIQREVEQASASARAIMLCIDSPGGAVSGCAETVAALRACDLPIHAYIDGQGCSAAYNLAACADYIHASQSAIVGSIGVILPWVDQGKAWNEMGMEWAPVKNQEADLKDSMMGPSLSSAQRANLQDFVQEAFEAFKGNVLASRAVDDTTMRGQAFWAPKAKELNLIDEVCTMRECMADLISGL